MKKQQTLFSFEINIFWGFCRKIGVVFVVFSILNFSLCDATVIENQYLKIKNQEPIIKNHDSRTLTTKFLIPHQNCAIWPPQNICFHNFSTHFCFAWIHPLFTKYVYDEKFFFCSSCDSWSISLMSTVVPIIYHFVYATKFHENKFHTYHDVVFLRKPTKKTFFVSWN